MRSFFERGQLAVAHLVQDAAGVLVAEVVRARALPLAEREQRGGCELWDERQRLQAREDAVAAEQRHEPRQSCGGKRTARHRERVEPERREVDEAAPVRVGQRFPVAAQRRCLADPRLEVAHHRPRPATFVRPVLRSSVAFGDGSEPGHHREVGGPLVVCTDGDVEAEAVAVDGRGLGRRDPRLTNERWALVAQHEAFVFHDRLAHSLLRERVLDLEQIGEVACRVDPHREVHRCRAVVQDRQLLVEAVAHGPPPDHREISVDVDGACARDEEELRLEVLEVVDRQRREPFAGQGQDPPREEPGVERRNVRMLRPAEP